MKPTTYGNLIALGEIAARLKLRIVLILALLVGMAATAAAQGTVCTFDDLSTVATNSLGNIPATYCGASWSAPNSNSPLYFSGSYYPFAAPNSNYGTISARSQPNALYLPFGGAEFIGMSFPAPVTFNGFWASSPSPTPCGSGCGIQIQVTMTLRGSLVQTVTVALPQGYTFISSGYSGQVDGVSINATSVDLGSGGIAIDDISYNGSCSASITPNTQQNFPTTGGTGTVMVTASAGCPWTATSSYSWITVTSGASGTGTGAPQTVTYSVAPNTSAGFQLGSLLIAGLSLPIQEAGAVQFQVQGVTAPNGALGTSNVIGGQPVTFSGSGWPADGGPITISGVQISPNTFSPPSFSGTFQMASIFSGSPNPPCSQQVTATQGSITRTVTLTGIYIGQVAIPDTGETGLDAGDQICGSEKYQIVQQFFESRLPVAQNGLFAVESETTDYGGSLFFVNNPESSVQFADGGILVNSGATLSFPDFTGATRSLQSHATAPIQSQIFQPVSGIGSAGSISGPYITSPLAGLQQVAGSLNQSGGVQLDNAGLYVNGDADINGGLAGLGFLFASGNIQISGNVNLASMGGSSTVTTEEISLGTLLFHTLPFTSEEVPVQVSTNSYASVQFAAGGNITFTGAPAPSVNSVPGALKQVSVGADGSVWGVNAQQQVYRYNTDPGWTNISGALTQVAVGSGTAIWGINAQQQIYRWDPVNSVWVNVPGSLTQVVVGADGDVWGINYQSSVYHYNAQTGSFGQVPGTLTQIVVGSGGAVYGLNAQGSIYWYNPGTGSFQWIANGFTQISVGTDGDLWAVNNNIAYHYDVLHDAMVAAGGASIAQIWVGSGTSVYGLSPGGQVFEWNAGSQNWTQISGTLSNIAVGANGALWGVNASQQIFTNGQVTRSYQALSLVPGSLTQISVGADGSTWGLNGTTLEYFNPELQSFVSISGAPELTQISVGAGADVWGVNSSGTIYQYSTTGNWNVIPGELKSVSVGANGSVWGINANGQTYTYNSSSQSWTNIAGNMVQLSVGTDGTVWSLDAQQKIYQFNPATQSWVNVPGFLAQIFVGNANNVWGLDGAQEVYYYNNATQAWVKVPGAYLTQISVGNDGTVWGVNSAGDLYQWLASTQSFSFVGVGMSSVFTANVKTVWALSSWGGIFAWF